MKPIAWTTDLSLGCSRDVAEFGLIRLTITTGGVHALGVNVVIGTVNGDVVAISATREECEKVILAEAKRRLFELGAELGKVLP